MIPAILIGSSNVILVVVPHDYFLWLIGKNGNGSYRDVKLSSPAGCDPILWHERGYPAIRPLCCADGGAGAVRPSISRRSAVPPRRRGSARHLALRLRNRYAPVPLAVMRRAENAEIFRVRAAALSDRQQVVELQQMGGGTAPAGDRITIAAASLIALPHQAPDGGGNGAPGSSGPCATAGTRRGPGSRTGAAAGR